MIAQHILVTTFTIYSMAEKIHISFSAHAKEKMRIRAIPQEVVVQHMLTMNNIIHKEPQDGKTKFVFSLSKRYKLVVVARKRVKGWFVVTVYKTSKKLEKLINKRKMPRGMIYRKRLK